MPVISAAVYLPIWSLALSLAWLWPYHGLPWLYFHPDAWTAACMLVAFFYVCWRSPGKLRWGWPHLLVLAMLPIPMLQLGMGLIAFLGDAWMVTLYLAGLLLAMHCGSRWQRASPDQPIDALALAFIIAGVASVAMQFLQWQSMGQQDASDSLPGVWRNWVMGLNGLRPYANVGQPNLLGTLLLWSMVSVVWGVHRGKICSAIGVALGLVLLFGLALTQSRTAWLGVAVLVASSWHWRKKLELGKAPVLASVLALLFVTATLLIVFDFGNPMSVNDGHAAERFTAGLRPAAWLMFIDAALSKPWIGFGWNQVMMAQLAVAENHPSFEAPFQQAHNLFLDLVLWCGLPIGLTISALILYWIFERFRSVRTRGQAITWLFLVIVGVHAMLELPLHYASFLLPAGLMIGALDVGSEPSKTLDTGRQPLLLAGIATTLAFAVSVYDYMGRLEPVFLSHLSDSPSARKNQHSPIPDVMMLTQLRDQLALPLYEVHSGMSDMLLHRVGDMAKRNPYPTHLYKFAQALAMNDRPEEARLWLSKARQIVPREQWRNIRLRWLHAAKTDPKIAAVSLPAD